VDTGSDDGTQDVIRNHMARLGIPGELYERPWRNFGHKLEADVNVWQLCGRKAGSYPRPHALHELSISIVHAFSGVWCHEVPHVNVSAKWWLVPHAW
jgi:hypothetical protein